MYSKFLVLKTKCVAQSHWTEEVRSRASPSVVTWNSRTPSFSGKQTPLLFSSPLIFPHFLQVFTKRYKVNMKKVLDIFFFSSTTERLQIFEGGSLPSKTVLLSTAVSKFHLLLSFRGKTPLVLALHLQWSYSNKLLKQALMLFGITLFT